ncbi:hypothetical protein [Dickeya dianthicola]|nr:hypothetical protein [Dickeya dianthicola]
MKEAVDERNRQMKETVNRRNSVMETSKITGGKVAAFPLRR